MTTRQQQQWLQKAMMMTRMILKRTNMMTIASTRVASIGSIDRVMR